VSSHLSGCPIVRDEVLTLYERVEVMREQKFFPFEQRILWLRESEAKVTLSHRGVHIDDVQTLNDWSGYLTSIETAIKDTAKLAKHYKIKRGDALSIDIALKITDLPVVLDTSLEGERWNKDSWRKRYKCVPSYYNGGKWWWLSADPDDNRRLETVEVDSLPRMYTTARHYIGKMPASVASWIEKARALAPEAVVSV
jgi:hypothetical protein